MKILPPFATFTRAIRAFLIILLIAGAGSAQLPLVQSSVEPTEPPIQWPRSHNFDMLHIALKLSFDWQKEMVFGEATLKLRPFEDNFREVELDAAELNIESVKLSNNSTLQFQILPEKLIVQLDRAYQANQEICFTIKYHAKPKQGLTFIKPSINDPNSPYQIWSQGESNTNHYWFPCYDFPNDRATSELIATVESKYRVISNGALVSVTEDKAQGLSTYHWRMDQPYSSYLLSIIVGEFAEIKHDVDGIPIYHYVAPDRVADGMRSFATVPDIIRFYHEKTGQPYPFSKYSETTVRNFGGGMENITATTLSETALRDERTMYDTDDGLSAHEVAHQWFGDLVTCRDWSELWLNEGFASFMASVWMEHSRGEEYYLRERLNLQQTLLQRYQQGYHRAVVTRHYNNPDDLFDENSYGRPQFILHMLRHMLGEKPFWQAINHYLTVNRDHMVTTVDLAHAIEESTGQNLDWFFDQWIYKMGQPELEIESSYDENAHQLKIRVKQVQKADAKRPWFEVEHAFRLPVEIAITTPSGTKVHEVVIDRADQEILLPADQQPLIVNFDRGNNILKTVRYPRSKQELMYQLRNDEDVTGRWRAAIELKNTGDDAAITALVAALKEDKSAIVRTQVAETLGTIKAEEARLALRDAIDDPDWHVRARAATELAQFKDINLLPLFQHLIEKDPSNQVVSMAAVAAGQTGAIAATEILLTLLKRDSSQDVLARSALEGLSYLKDGRLLEIGINYAAPGKSNTLRSIALNLLGTYGKGNTQALALINTALNDTTSQLPFYAIQALNELGDEAALNSLEQYLKIENITADARSLAEQAISRLKQKLKSEDGKKHAKR